MRQVGAGRFLSICPQCPEAAVPQLQPTREQERATSAAAVPTAVCAAQLRCSPLGRQWNGVWCEADTGEFVRMWLAVPIYVVLAQALSELRDGEGPHAGSCRARRRPNLTLKRPNPVHGRIRPRPKREANAASSGQRDGTQPPRTNYTHLRSDAISGELLTQVFRAELLPHRRARR